MGLLPQRAQSLRKGRRVLREGSGIFLERDINILNFLNDLK